ncbi:MAG: sensor histidine kinase [Lachnospiraceae bacterium]|jgi:two-component system sensor histidine kinase YesM|nr:sensor histidine kinase [Lachnospiraceae bacterium]
MKEKIKQLYNNSTLAMKIRYFYLMLLVPIMIFLVFLLYNLWVVNRSYEGMINSSVVASEFSLDFKKDFDYETYLLIVENKSIEEAKLDDMLSDANRIVERLEEFTNSKENISRLNSAKKYLKNLGIYKERIEQNLIEGNKYEVNLEIWENDVQIVTSLLQDTIFQYIYYEISDLQQLSAEYQKFFVETVRFFLIAFACIFVSILFFSYYIPLSITRPIRKLSEVTDQVAKGDLSVRFDARSGVEVNRLSDSLNTMIDKINELLEQVTTEQIRLRKAEFELLQTQINPHFLYNTLDTIIWLAEAGKQREVVGMVGSLSEFFRASLNQGKDIISIREELQHVKSYLEIQQVRYQDILKYEIQVPGELDKYLIPKITIQPIVENALYHGIKNKRGLGRIRVSGKKEEGGFAIQVEDNGIGINEERLRQVRDKIQYRTPAENDIYGLYNVNERIRLNFGEKFGISIESVYGEGTVVSIHLPYGEEGK